MTYTPKDHPQIATGRRTQARYPIRTTRTVKRPGPRGIPRTGKSATREQQPYTPEISDLLAYTVPTTTEGHDPETRHVVITTVRQQRLGDVNLQDAKAEGHDTLTAFRRWWVRRHDKPWVTARISNEDLPALLLQRFNTHWANTLVHAVTFERTESKPRFLLASSAREDYTSSRSRSIDPDAECVDDATLDKYAKDALPFCIGRQLARAKEQANKRDQRARQFRRAA